MPLHSGARNHAPWCTFSHDGSCPENTELSENVSTAFREHRLLRAALVALMERARPYLEPAGARGDAAMYQARCALEGKEPSAAAQEWLTRQAAGDEE